MNMDHQSLTNGLLNGDAHYTVNKKSPKNSVFSSMLSLSSGIVGAGMLSLPLSLSLSGLVIGVAFIVSTACTYIFLYRLVVYGMQLTHQIDYFGLVRHLYGEAWKLVTQISVLILLFGVLAIYQSLIVSFWEEILDFMGYNTGVELFIVLNLAFVILLSILTLPMYASSFFRYLALASVFPLSYLIFLCVIEIPNNNLRHVQMTKVEVSSLYSFSITAFSFCNIIVVPEIFMKLKNRTNADMNRVIDWSLLSVTALYLLLAVCGYLSNPLNTPELITQQDHLQMVIAKAAFSVCFLGNYVCNLNSLRTVLFGILNKYEDKGVAYYTTNNVVFVLVGILATSFHRVLAYVTFLGGSVVIVHSIVVPTMIYWKMSANWTLLPALVSWKSFLSILGFGSCLLTVLGY